MKIDLILSSIVIAIGIYGIGTSKNIIKSIVCLNIVQAAIILLFLSFGYVEYGIPPIVTEKIGYMTDPLPQALMITAIVIGATITSLALMLSIKVFHYYGTLEWNEFLERKG